MLNPSTGVMEIGGSLDLVGARLDHLQISRPVEDPVSKTRVMVSEEQALT